VNAIRNKNKLVLWGTGRCA